MTRLTELFQPGVWAGYNQPSETTISNVYPGWTHTGSFLTHSTYEATRVAAGVTVPAYWTFALSTTLGRSYYAHMTFTYSGFEGLASVLMRYRAGSTSLVSVRFTTAGVLQLWNDVAESQIGSDFQLYDRWGGSSDIQLKLNIGTGSVDSVELVWGETSVASATGLSLSDSVITAWDVGAITLSSTPTNWTFRDLAINDDQGAVNNSWPGRIRIVNVEGWDILNEAGWTSGAGGGFPGAEAWGSLAGDTTPTDSTQIRNATSQASNYFRFQDQAYSARQAQFIALVDSDAVYIFCDGVHGVVSSYQTVAYGHAEETATGTKAGTLQLSSNPALTAVSFNFGNDAGAWSADYAGTTTGNWYNSRSAVVYDTPDDYAAPAQLTLTKVTATTAAVSICGVFVFYEWHPVPDFGISAVEEKLVEGLSDTTPVDATVIIGNEAITLSATDLPTDVTVDFDPTVVSPGGTSAMNFTVAGSVAEGTSATINVIGTAASATHSAPMKIKIRKKPQPISVYLWGGL